MKNKNFISLLAIIGFSCTFHSCDKIEPPYVETSSTSTTQNSYGIINLLDIKGTASDFKVTDNWSKDSSALRAAWTVTPTSSGADGTIEFTWHEVSTTLNITSASGIITFNGPVTINGGGDFGVLSFKYEGTFTSDGSGEGYVVAYIVQNILIEDYTGHTCGNCPPAAEKITELKGIYGDRVISMAVHAGGYAYPFPPKYTYDFRTPVGTDLDASFGISNAGNPNGMVNRITFPGGKIASWGSWAGHVSDIVIQNNLPDAGIKIENTYVASDSTVSIKVKAGFFNDLTGTYNMCVYLIEDSIKQWQKDYRFQPPPADDIENYWHRDALRGSANGTWGDILTPTTKGTIIEKNYSMTIKSTYRPAYCKILVLIYNDATKEILQVKEAPIIQ